MSGTEADLIVVAIFTPGACLLALFLFIAWLKTLR